MNRLLPLGGPKGLPGPTGAGVILDPGDARRRLFHPEAPSLNPKFFRNGIVMLVLVVGTAALLFTWLTSSTQTTDTSYSQFLEHVQAGEVSKVVQADNKLTVTPPTRQHLRGLRPRRAGAPNSDVYGDMQAAAEKGNKELGPEAYRPSSRSPTTRGSGCC